MVLENIDLNLVSIIAFYSLIIYGFFSVRKKIVVERFLGLPLVFLYRTKHGLKSIRKIASYKKFWKYFGLVAIPVGFLGMIFVLGALVNSIYGMFLDPSTPAGVSLVLPGVKIPGASIFVPFWYGIIALIFVVVVHEGGHGIVSEALGYKIKSSGLGMLALLPIAFVEPDEEKIKKAKLRDQLSIFAAGPFTNIVTAILFVFLFLFVVSPVAAKVLQNDGIFIDSLDTGYPAELAGLEEGDILREVNGVDVTNASEFVDTLAVLKPGDKVNIISDEGTFDLELGENPTNSSKGYMGVQFKQNIGVAEHLKDRYGSLPFGIYYLLNLIYWIVALNFGIGIVNLLPLGPIDGGRMLNVFLNKKLKNKKLGMSLYSAVSSFSLIVLLLAIFGPFFIKLIA
jgi:membrane-associated protease RseP (regulator of RpoE activity)